MNLKKVLKWVTVQMFNIVKLTLGAKEMRISKDFQSGSLCKWATSVRA